MGIKNNEAGMVPVKVYIMLPVHNRREVTRRFIACLKDQTYANYHLILIDDGSTDGTAEMAQAQIEALTIIKGDGKWWWAGSLQRGLVHLKSLRTSPLDMVLIINDDTEFGPDLIENAVGCLSGRKRTILLARSYSRNTNQVADAGIHIDWKELTFNQAGGKDAVNCFSTRGLFLRYGDFLDIGGFHPRLIPHYLSDYEFTHRAYRKGFSLTTVEDVYVKIDETPAGYNPAAVKSPVEFLRKYFSKKSYSNVMAWFFFIGFACPWPWKVLNWTRLVKRALFAAARALFGGLKAKRLANGAR